MHYKTNEKGETHEPIKRKSDHRCAAVLFCYHLLRSADLHENIVVGMFVLYGVIVSLAVFSLRRSTYRKILEMEPKTYKKIVGSKGKQRPLEIYREKGERYSPPIEELIRTYNTFRLVGVVMIVISLAADALLLK